jgi:outer membrane lipoprotein SlyB
VIGGVLGAIVGRELADDSSRGRRNTATVAGAAAGALAGNAVENRANEESFDVTVRMDDGRRLTVNVTTLPNGVRNGAYVRYDGRRLQALR